MAMQYWLVKQEPEDYSWDHLMEDKRTAWTGVRNFAARNSLRKMQPGDLTLFYHSGKDKAVVGIARVDREAYADPTAKADDGDWTAVDLAPVKRLEAPVSLATIKADAALKEMPLIRQSRLSVMPVTSAEFKRILALGKTNL